MTQKTLGELSHEYWQHCENCNECKEETDYAYRYIIALESALTPNWTKLPELPKDEEFVTQYWITKTNGEVSLVYWNPIDKTFQWTIMGATKLGSSNILAWAKLIRPEPFKGDV